MRSDVRKSTASGTDASDLSPTTVFQLLTDDRRRYALHYLSQKVGAVPLGELAEQIALWEGDPTRDRYDRVLTGLSHVHLPRLTDAGVVRYDPVRETVELLEAAETVRPFLKLTVQDDLQ